MENINRSFYSAILQSLQSKYIIYIFNLISLMILARLFSPENFGAIAALMVFFNFFRLLGEGGLSPSIINLEYLSPENRNGIFSFFLIMSACSFVLFYAAANFAVSFYNFENFNYVVEIISLSLFFYILSAFPNAMLLREKMFKKIAIIGVISEILSLIAVLLLYKHYPPLLSLSLKYLVSAIILFCLSYLFSKDTEFGMPFFGRNISSFAIIKRTSTYTLGFNIVNYFPRNLDNIAVVKFFGEASLGLYDNAYRIMRYPMLLLSNAMSPAIQPVVKNLKNLPSKAVELHHNFVKRLLFIGLFFASGIFFFSEIIIQIILGSKWIESAPILQILALSIPFQMALATAGGFFQSFEKPNLLFTNGLLTSLIFIACLSISLVFNDLLVVCWSILLSITINFYITYIMINKNVFESNFLSFLKEIWLVNVLIFILYLYALISS